MITIAWIILALGALVFLAEVGEGLKNYLSNKGLAKKEGVVDESKQPDPGPYVS